MKLSITNKKDENIFITFLSLLKVKHTSKFSNQYYNKHPHKYSLFGLSKMFSDYGIKNIGVKIKDKELDILEIETPFIAHIESEFVIVKKVTSQEVCYIRNSENMVLSQKEFQKVWTGVSLIAEANEESIEPDYKEHLKLDIINFSKKILLFFITGIFILLIYISQHQYNKLGINLSLLLNLAGIYTCYLLVIKQMQIHNKYADKLCSLFKQSNCNNILESEAAKLWGVIGWSEIGLGYFIANTLILLFFSQLMTYLAIINICTLPYTIWSLWYQGYKVKQWCTLCLIIQVLLWTIFIVNLFFGFIQILQFHIYDIFIIVCIYSIPFLIISILIPKLVEGSKIEQITQEIISLKADDEVFITLLKKQPFYKVSKDSSRILLGNPHADILVTILTNPHCDPCAKMHKRVKELLDKESDSICIQYIFSSFDQSLNSSNKFLISAYFNKKEEFLSVFDKWFEYGRNDKNKFFRQFKLDITTNSVLEEFSKHEEWKKETGLRSTPTILINGYKLLDNYKIEDIRYFRKIGL